LAERIVSELDSRDLAWWGPWLSDGPNSKVQVLLLSEGDTEYSRGLRTVFRDAFERKLGGNKYVVAEAAYLQGLDGKLPAIDKKTNPNPKGDDRKSQETITAEGNRQQDYWLRYADILTRNGVRYRAIGILGSDPYDKLTLLKALRSAYPDALFFTNDLDARLAQPEFLPWTNGLIIATHYGLALNEQLQEGIPPFRSSYQTSSYLACMHLLSNLEANKADWSPLVNLEIEQLKVALQRNNWPNDWHEVAFKHARVYEMGRNGPIALESGETQVQSVHPAPAASPPPGKIDVLFFVVFLLILSVLLWMTSRDFRGKCIALFSIFKKRPFISWGSLVAGLVLIAALVVGYLIDPIKEPWSLTDGISIWPTIVLRIGAVTVGLFLMRRAYCKWAIRMIRKSLLVF
jgi:hypothetical protein